MFAFQCLLICGMARSQDDIPSSSKFADYDTNFYRVYEDRLVIGLYSAYQNYNLEITQKSISDPKGISHINYVSDAAAVNGIIINYDKINIAFAYKSNPQADSYKKGHTRFNGFGLNIGADKWQLEANYRNYNWFYDLSTALYDTSYKPEKPYYQNPSMNAENVKFKFMYFPLNKKFSYQSAYACNERQLKSYFSPVWTANLYFSNLSADTSLIPYFIRPYYGYSSDVNRLHTFAFSAAGGMTGTWVVYKRFFLNGMFVFGLESQYNTYHHFNTDLTNSAEYINWTSDIRVALGFNNRNFFFTVNIINDVSHSHSGLFDVNSNFKLVSFTLGYRFKVKEPRVVTTIHNTKLYKLL